jgi:hypothetical protein
MFAQKRTSSMEVASHHLLANPWPPSNPAVNTGVSPQNQNFFLKKKNFDIPRSKMGDL